ncbi:hypothetical protein AAFF_G00350320 [Aldrovandia affinis]|uniref:Uncharacterized protein n=1 Tax=Aldrovandia affinis TaxID=143900 RepID=A0AAD7R5S1_9TELE|nr:hypothetical protein AAFF_G00350320 [Aldrovandia affinis]
MYYVRLGARVQLSEFCSPKKKSHSLFPSTQSSAHLQTCPTQRKYWMRWWKRHRRKVRLIVRLVLRS